MKNNETKVLDGAVALRNALWKTIKEVQSGDMDPARAHAINRAAKELLATIKAERDTAADPVKTDETQKFFKLSKSSTSGAGENGV